MRNSTSNFALLHQYRKLLDKRQKMKNLYRKGIDTKIIKDNDSYIINKKPRPRDIMNLYKKK